MKILLLGANGQIGWELQRSLLPHGPITVCDRQALDLEDLPAVRAYIRALQPQIIVNAAAFTAVDAAESNRKTAHQINADAVEVLAQEAKALDAWLIHYSTDCVWPNQTRWRTLNTSQRLQALDLSYQLDLCSAWV